MRKALFWMMPGIVLVLALSGCTVHPAGERAERRSAIEAGRIYQTPRARRHLTPLPADATPAELVRYALENNAAVEQAYWNWRAAIEQIPQDGTQGSNLALFANLGIKNGAMSLDRATISAGNDPMADIVLPSKLSTAAKRALENARAAGWRFREAQFKLRGEVLTAYDNYALTAELIRLEQSNLTLLSAIIPVETARSQAGEGSQQNLLKALNEVDLERNSIAGLQARLPAQRARINASLSRPADAPLPVPDSLPASSPITGSDHEILRRAAQNNPQLAVLAKGIASEKQSITLAKLQRVPDFSLTMGSSLSGVAQSLAGMLTVPLLRYQAIEGAIAQAQDRLRAGESAYAQSANDLSARVVEDLAIVRDSDRQLRLFDQTILPRANEIVELARIGYESGKFTLDNALEAQRSLIAIQKLVAQLRIDRENRLVDLESAGLLIPAGIPSTRNIPQSR